MISLCLIADFHGRLVSFGNRPREGAGGGSRVLKRYRGVSTLKLSLFSARGVCLAVGPWKSSCLWFTKLNGLKNVVANFWSFRFCREEEFRGHFGGEKVRLHLNYITILGVGIAINVTFIHSLLRLFVLRRKIRNPLMWIISWVRIPKFFLSCHYKFCFLVCVGEWHQIFGHSDFWLLKNNLKPDMIISNIQEYPSHWQG